MADDMQAIFDAADQLGRLVSKHPAYDRYRQAHKALRDDPEASRLMGDFARQIETLARQEQQGMPLTDAQRQQVEALQDRIASHLRIKAFSLAEVEFTDMLRKVSMAWQRHLDDMPGGGVAAAPTSGPRMVAPR